MGLLSRGGAERQIDGTVICVINVIGMIGYGGWGMGIGGSSSCKVRKLSELGLS